MSSLAARTLLCLLLYGAAASFAAGPESGLATDGVSVVIGAEGGGMADWDGFKSVALSVKQNTGPVETSEFIELLQSSFDVLDTDEDNQVSYAEAIVALPGLTQAQFDEVDTDGDGQISRSEADACGGCCGCACGPGGLEHRLGDLFVAGLAVAFMALFGGALFRL